MKEQQLQLAELLQGNDHVLGNIQAIGTGYFWWDLTHIFFQLHRGPFKYYVSKDVAGWGQKMAIFADLQYYLYWLRWVGEPKKAKNMLT